MLSCSSDNNYWASPEFLSFALHTMTCISLPLHILGFYCILYQTPNQMSSVKILLLNLHVCSFTLDILITFFAVPYAIFPAMAGYGLGIIDSPGLFLYLIVTVITATSTSVVLIFENIFFVLFAEDSWWKHVRKYVLTFSYIMVPIYFLPAQFYIPEQEKARKVSLECQPKLPAHRELLVLSTDFIVPAYSIIIAEGVPAVQLNILFGLNFYYLIWAKPASNLSQNTIKLQRKLTFALFIQSYAMVLLFSVPINVVVFVIKTWYHSQAINNLVFVGLSVHGTISTLIMVFIHKPYRSFVMGPVNRLFYKTPIITVRSNDSATWFSSANGSAN
ncbi:hypothetical protein CRE_08825 [Caenorhabditis remanei]|uniref:Serpentine Receptor, class H n=1 Tax=Caenorhabditis remanei TaxID=31234 RepID=E3LHR2_CAERE|nr:hypothetical protein CRE_08825 [Caenorhabditis remanei]